MFGARRLSIICRHLSPSLHSTRLLSTTCSASQAKKEMSVLDGKMTYVDTEKNGDNVVIFLHGNPTSSYLWRNIIPRVSDHARCIAPDLIGMGDSSKLDTSMYTFDDHFKYLSKWMESMDLPEKVNLVIHDWGSSLGFHWANLHRSRVSSITHMESLVCSIPSWDDFPDTARKIFQAMRSPAGEEIVLKKNFFVEKLLPLSVMRGLTEEEMSTYVAPFKTPGRDRLPTLTWPREIPVKSDGPENVVKIADAYSEWLVQSSDLPKLYIDAKPGFFSPFIREYIKDWPNQSIVTVKGIHFLQEDSPTEIGDAITKFLREKVF